LDWVAMIEICLDSINLKSYKKLFLFATTWSKILTA
jgi:hypothetical protein